MSGKIGRNSRTSGKTSSPRSAYDVAILNGFQGTEQQFLDSLVGPQGIQGPEGDSAFDIAVAAGFTGTEQEWLESLVGEDGAQGVDGQSAFEIAVANGFTGTEQEWLESLIGEDGIQGVDGADGLSAYEVAEENGFTGTEQEWLDSLVGPAGAAILDVDAYDITASAGSNVSVTLTHNIGHTEYFVQVVDSSNNNIVIPFTRNANDAVFYFGEVSSDTDYRILISGSNTTDIVGAITTNVTESVIESLAASSARLPEIESYTITATVGTSVFVTLTHNIGVSGSDYIVQVIDSNKNNIVLPFTRNSNEVIFYFGNVTVEQDYKVVIVH